MTDNVGPWHWITRWAQERPDATAVVHAKACLSYRALVEHVAERAAQLRANAVPGTIICLAVEDALELRILRWAADAADLVDALIDPRLPPAAQADRARRAGASMPLRSPADAIGPTLGSVGHEPGRMLFTTGTTGAPRAVLQRRAALESAARSNALLRGILATDRVLAALPAFHSAGSLFEDTALYVGGSLALCDERGAQALARELAELAPTVVSLLPAQIAPLLEGGALGGLRVLNYAGDAISEDLLERLLDRFPGEVFRGYGLTEAGPLVAALTNEEHRRRAHATSCVGKPAPFVEVEIRDGELWVRSPHLMTGYLNDVEATRSRLVDGWLRTGDLAVLDGDGRIELRGRADDRMRSGGEWIHPREIETVLGSLPGVREVVVVAVPDATWGERPYAFILADHPPSTADIEAVLTEKLARFQWPDQVETLPELPRLSTGKADRRLLRACAEHARAQRPDSRP